MQQRGLLTVGLFTFLFSIIFNAGGSIAQEAATSDFSTAETSLTDHQAWVYFVQGNAQVLKKNNPTWETLSVGSPIQEGDQIRTSSDSSVEVEFDKFLQNRSRIEANTVAEFKSIEPTQIHLTDGTLLNMLEGLPSGSGFEVTSPTAVASVRGTIFMTSYQAAVQTQKASVIQGQVQIFVPKGQESTETELPGWTIKKYESLKLDFQPAALANLQKTATHLMSPEDLMDLKAQVEESRTHLEEFHGGGQGIEQGLAAWNELRTDLHRLETVEKTLQQGARKLFAPQLEKSAALAADQAKSGASSDEVTINARIVKTEAEQNEQDQLLGAKEAALGSTSDESKAVLV